MKILLDVLGGDNAPEAPLEGAIDALKEFPDLNLVLSGPAKIIEEKLTKAGIPSSRYEILPAETSVLNTDHPANFLRTKPDCSMAVAFSAMKERDDIDAFLGAGPTGAMLSGCIFKLGRIPGVKRPGLIATIPTKKETLVRVLDAGANMDCKPEYLVQFAKMANAYLKVLGIEKPRIGLLSVGMEEGKGNELVKEVFPLLKEDPELHFIGNVEGDKVLDGICDLLVCDGFDGNVFIKSLEGAAYFVSDLFKEAVMGTFVRKIGALFQLKALKKVKKPFHYANDAAAPLLGCKKLVVKCHGKSKARQFYGAIKEVMGYVNHHLIEKVTEAIASKEAA